MNENVIGCDLELDSIYVFITENGWAMLQKWFRSGCEL